MIQEKLERIKATKQIEDLHKRAIAIPKWPYAAPKVRPGPAPRPPFTFDEPAPEALPESTSPAKLFKLLSEDPKYGPAFKRAMGVLASELEQGQLARGKIDLIEQQFVDYDENDTLTSAEVEYMERIREILKRG
jgi:hypothetical protein